MTFLLAWLPILCSIGLQTNETIVTVPYELDTVRHLVGKRVATTGALFHAMTAHHRTEVIMIDEKIEH